MPYYYAVRIGKKPGIYSSWDDCAKQVLGVKGGVYKKFSSQSEALAFIGPLKKHHSIRRTTSILNSSTNSGDSLTQTRLQKPSVKISSSETDILDEEFPVVLVRNINDSHSSSTVDNRKSRCCSSSTIVLISRKDNANQGRKFHQCVMCKKFVAWDDAAISPASSLPLSASASMKEHREVDYSLLVYTDGACLGNRNVQNSNNPAGWGVVFFKPDMTTMIEMFGPVWIDKTSQYYMQAKVASNNTAELSAIGEALLWICDFGTANENVCICYDSEYAHKSVVGIFNGEKNRELIGYIRSILNSVLLKFRKGTGSLSWKHVKGHSNDIGNDKADLLAGKGARGEICSVGRYCK